ncbi:TPA: hypothetical protein STY68_001038 [Clostridioides difficile]|uniref:Uncharacterized protein n=1 Tax=Clostridium phage CDKM15 TaxID=1868595 RepID=A0A3G1E3E0_9CAUD|nr:hypothetical protein [Clostridioides difficile]YP_009830876.1 hypothetical protein HWA98_gp05 [Clostridium phage CDKM15]ANT45148.1 hypothetical protein CDKM15_5 [Clostridium phage CDKM15]EJA6787272.1 hypothetical protein [Clostridioides difficile]EJA6849987.1 hypothetical protein [Clostridioides difficile]ELX4514084.1 hypothetical protein [Clostridioides difficile]KAK2255890.1 hypothetical protein XC33_17990 [Clostridioides difficile]
MNVITGEMDSMNALISSIKPSDIPLAKDIDIEALKSIDDDPLEVVVEIPATKSKRGWNYTAKSLKDIVDYTNENTLNGFLGHQKAENISTEFAPPVTHWIGAEMKGDKAYFRGLIDADATNLKRWIRTKRIKEVSIFGYPKLKKSAKGEMNVIGYEPLSIDWTPLHRPGMPTSIVGMEMSARGEQLDGTFEALRIDLREALKTKFSINDNNSYLYIQNIRYDNNTVIYELEQNGLCKLYSIPFTIVENKINLGQEIEVIKKISYEAKGEMKGEENKLEGKELIKNVKGLLQTGEISYSEVIQGIGLTKEIVTGEMEDVKSSLKAEKELREVKKVLGIVGEMDTIEVAKKASKALDNEKKEAWNSIVNKVIKDKVSGEIAQTLVKKMLNVEEGSSEEVITGEIENILNDEFVKNTMSNMYKDNPTTTGLSNSSNNGSLITKKNRI